MTPSHLASIRGEHLRLNRGKGLVGQADVVHLAINAQGREVRGHVELVRRVGGVEHEVEGECPRLGPVIVFGEDELFRSQFLGRIFLVGTGGEDVYLGAHGGGEHDCEMTEAAAGNLRVRN